MEITRMSAHTKHAYKQVKYYVDIIALRVRAWHVHSFRGMRKKGKSFCSILYAMYPRKANPTSKPATSWFIDDTDFGNTIRESVYNAGTLQSPNAMLAAHSKTSVDASPQRMNGLM
jgi:hypothetical protein